MSFAKKIMVVVLLLAAGSLAAAAQDRTVTFTLKQDAYFGTRLLPSGSYRLQLTSDPTPKAIVMSMGEQAFSAIAVVSGREYSALCTNTSITFSPNHDKLAMSSICLADSDLTYYFPTINLQRNRQVAEAQPLAGMR